MDMDNEQYLMDDEQVAKYKAQVALMGIKPWLDVSDKILAEEMSVSGRLIYKVSAIDAAPIAKIKQKELMSKALNERSSSFLELGPKTETLLQSLGIHKNKKNVTLRNVINLFGKSYRHPVKVSFDISSDKVVVTFRIDDEVDRIVSLELNTNHETPHCFAITDAIEQLMLHRIYNEL